MRKGWCKAAAGLWLILLGAATSPRPAWAEPAAPETSSHDGVGLVLGAKLGGGMGAPFNQFGGTLAAEVELGYRLPLPAPIGRSFELFSSFAYGAPHTAGTSRIHDARLPAGGFGYSLEEQIAALGFGLLYRANLPAHLLAPYAAAGARLHLTQTKVRGSSGTKPFGENAETASAWGLYLAGGLDFYLGPGAALVELQLDYSAIDNFVLRDTNLGALNLLVGYRLFF